MIFRLARHTNNLKPLIEFYCTILNFEVLGSFENHNDYNGVFLGKQNLDWHLEFTESKEKATHTFDDDDILVFYPTNEAEQTEIIKNIMKYKIIELEPVNPYWKQNGIMIEDPYKYKIVVVNFKIK